MRDILRRHADNVHAGGDARRCLTAISPVL